MKAIISITPRQAVLDPQGEAIGQAITALGFKGITNVRQGKLITLDLAETLNKEEASQHLTHLCQQLLANPIMEDFHIEILSS
jgi:phosphoribosylformylglycinamidine synthase subunit PurS